MRRFAPTRADAAREPPPGEEVLDYRQTYKWVPVFGRGYVVHRHATSKAVKAFTGRVEHGLSLDTTAGRGRTDGVRSRPHHRGARRERIRIASPPRKARDLRSYGRQAAKLGARLVLRSAGQERQAPAIRGRLREERIRAGADVVARRRRARVHLDRRDQPRHHFDRSFGDRLSADALVHPKGVKAYRTNENVATPYLLYSDGVAPGPAGDSDAGPTIATKPRMFAECTG